MSDIYRISGDTLTDIADAIRLKRDTVDDIKPEDMSLEISLIESGGGGSDSWQLVDEQIFTLSSDYTGTSSSALFTVSQSNIFEGADKIPETNLNDYFPAPEALKLYYGEIEYLGVVDYADSQNQSFIKARGVGQMCPNSGAATVYAMQNNMPWREFSTTGTPNRIKGINTQNYGVYINFVRNNGAYTVYARCASNTCSVVKAGEYRVRWYRNSF